MPIAISGKAWSIPENAVSVSDAIVCHNNPHNRFSEAGIMISLDILQGSLSYKNSRNLANGLSVKRELYITSNNVFEILQDSCIFFLTKSEEGIPPPDSTRYIRKFEVLAWWHPNLLPFLSIGFIQGGVGAYQGVTIGIKGNEVCKAMQESGYSNILKNCEQEGYTVTGIGFSGGIRQVDEQTDYEKRTGNIDPARMIPTDW